MVVYYETMLNLWVVGLLVALLLLLGMVEQPIDKVVFLDVGQGDAILLQDGTKQVLIDGGQGSMVLQRLGEEMPWFDRSIEVVIATHPDRDHLEGLLHVLERYDVGLVVLPQMPHTSQLQEAWLDQLHAGLEQNRIAYRFAEPGQQLQISDALALTILGPQEVNGVVYAPGNKTNNAAVITRVDFSGLAWLLTSDAESVVERALVGRSSADLDVDILKAGHHGSKTSTTAELLEAATPSAVVISVGADNQYGHPHPTVMERLAPYKIWRTDTMGSIAFTHVSDQWLVSSQR